VAEEMTTLTDEITSLRKVIVKLEGEMRQAMKMKGECWLDEVNTGTWVLTRISRRDHW